MDDSAKLQDIIDGNEALTQKVDEISRAISEDAHAYSIFSKAKDSFKKWIGMWLGFLALFFAGIGITSYNGAVELLAQSEDIKNRVIEKVSPEIRNAVLEKSETQIKEQLQKNNAELEAHMANIRAEADKKINSIVQQFNAQLEAISDKKQITPITIAAYPIASGYAFYGIRSGTDWDSRYFKVIGDAPAEPPKVGDTLEALSNVNIRKDYISFGIKGWSNAPTLGVIIPQDKLEVIEVKQVVNGYYWIRFENRRRENS